jgi:hypothetical protein
MRTYFIHVLPSCQLFAYRKSPCSKLPQFISRTHLLIGICMSAVAASVMVPRSDWDGVCADASTKAHVLYIVISRYE